jgi:hypothetical protein
MTIKYSANLTWEPFLWYEMTVVSDLLWQWLSDDEIKLKVVSENLFQYKTLKSIPKRLSCVLRRIKKLDETLIKKLSEWNNEESRIISLYAIYKDSSLVYDFINEFIWEKFQLKQFEIKDSEIMSFFNSKAREYIEMNEWSDSTIRKIRQILKNILSWAGILHKKTLQSPVVWFQLKKYFEENWDTAFMSNLWI